MLYRFTYPDAREVTVLLGLSQVFAREVVEGR